MLMLLIGASASAASIGDLLRRAIASGQPESGWLEGPLGDFFMRQQGRRLQVQLKVIEKLAGDCARFEARLRLERAAAMLASVQFDLCADGSAPARQQ